MIWLLKVHETSYRRSHIILYEALTVPSISTKGAITYHFKSMNTNKTFIGGNPVPGLGHAQKCGGVIYVNRL